MATSHLARRLRHRVDVQDLVTVRNSDEATVESWVSLLSSDEELLPAEIVPLSGREFIASAQMQAGVNTRITLRRWRLDFTERMRIVHPSEGTIYNIKAVLPDPTFRHHVTLMCEAGVNDG